MCVADTYPKSQTGGLSVAKATRLVRPRTVTADGEGLASHAGLVWLGEVADRTGLTAGLSAAMAERPRRRHDPGVTLAQMALALADGATCVSDLAVLRDQPGLFGPVASHATAWAHDRRAGAEVVIDLDATLVTTKRTSKTLRPPTSAATGTIRSWRCAPRPARSSRSCCAPATRGRTPPLTTSRSSVPRSRSCPKRGAPAKRGATIP